MGNEHPHHKKKDIKDLDVPIIGLDATNSQGVRVLGQINYACDGCKRRIEANEDRWVCWECGEDVSSYDLCTECQGAHPHQPLVGAIRKENSK